MKHSLKLTPEWVMEKLPHSYCCDGKGNVSVYTGNATDANWIELALESLHIAYNAYDYVDGNNEILFGFDFKIEDVKSECPFFHKRMKNLDVSSEIYKKLEKK
jgi:hypothetical protein